MLRDEQILVIALSPLHYFCAEILWMLFCFRQWCGNSYSWWILFQELSFFARFSDFLQAISHLMPFSKITGEKEATSKPVYKVLPKTLWRLFFFNHFEKLKYAVDIVKLWYVVSPFLIHFKVWIWVTTGITNFWNYLVWKKRDKTNIWGFQIL